MTLLNHVRAYPALALAAALAVTSCSGDTSDAAEDNSLTSDSEAEESAFPVTVEHEFGETVVEEQPERVVSIGWGDLDNILAMGTTPVGYMDPGAYGEISPWAEDLMEGAPPQHLGSTPEFDFEEIAALQPDLIIAVQGHTVDEEVYATLSDIAPTVTQPEGINAWRVDPEMGARHISTALGVPEAGEELVQELEDSFSAVPEDYPAFDGASGVVVLPYDGKYGAYNTGDGRGAFLDDLGLALPTAVAEDDTGGSVFVEVSEEQVGVLESDIMVFVTDDPDYNPAAENRLFEAFDSEFVVVTGHERWSITLNTPNSLMYALEHLVPRISEALET